MVRVKMKHYKDKKNNVYAYEPDGSRDHLIPKDFVSITDTEAKALTTVIPTYDVKRASEYPLIQDQLDDIYHNGIDGWKKTIKAIKDKYPKE